MIDTAQILRHQLQRAGGFDRLQNDAVSTQQMNQAAVQSGQAMGYKLEVERNALADLYDSMEELTFQFEEKEMKTTGERKLGELHSAKSLYLTAVERWRKVLPDMPGGEFMERMLRSLRQAGVLPDPRTLLKMLGKGSEDPTHQFAMLDAMEAELAQDETPEAPRQGTEAPRQGAEAQRANDAQLKSLIAGAKRLLEQEKGAEVRAGLNLAEVVNARAETPEQMQGLRDLYRGKVLGFTTPQDCFRSLLAERGAGRLAEAIDFLFAGLGVDLQSASPSRSTEELRRVLTDLQCVEVLKTVLEKCTSLAGKMASQFGETCLLDGERLTGKIVDFTEMPFVSAGNIAALVTSCGLQQLLAQLYFCTTLSGLFRSLSPRLFGEAGGRFRLIDAAQEHLDGLVMQQEDAEREAKERGRKGAAA